MLILYTTEDGRSRIQLRADEQTVWLTQREMAELFDVTTDNVGLHLKNIFEDGELIREATTEDSSVVQIEGQREVRRTVTLYNLDAILAVGYRVRSVRGVQFRRWASTVQSSGCQFLRDARWRRSQRMVWSAKIATEQARAQAAGMEFSVRRTMTMWGSPARAMARVWRLKMSMAMNPPASGRSALARENCGGLRRTHTRAAANDARMIAASSG